MLSFLQIVFLGYILGVFTDSWLFGWEEFPYDKLKLAYFHLVKWSCKGSKHFLILYRLSFVKIVRCPTLRRDKYLMMSKGLRKDIKDNKKVKNGNEQFKSRKYLARTDRCTSRSTSRYCTIVQATIRSSTGLGTKYLWSKGWSWPYNRREGIWYN